jgi:hypothetical protein
MVIGQQTGFVDDECGFIAHQARLVVDERTLVRLQARLLDDECVFIDLPTLLLDDEAPVPRGEERQNPFQSSDLPVIPSRLGGLAALPLAIDDRGPRFRAGSGSPWGA